jgi:hypothetical protein
MRARGLPEPFGSGYETRDQVGGRAGPDRAGLFDRRLGDAPGYGATLKAPRMNGWMRQK